MSQKPIPSKPEPLTAAIIAYMQPGEERADGQCAGLRVRCLGSGKKVFFYRYRSRDDALREIKLGEVGPLTLAKARLAVGRKRLEREQGKDPQLEKRKEYLQARRDRAVTWYSSGFESDMRLLHLTGLSPQCALAGGRPA